jgi:hypothetical protein
VIEIKRHRVALATIVVIAVAGWFGVREYRCKLRGTVFAQQVESIKRDAAKDLRVGTNKADVVHFFFRTQHSFQDIGFRSIWVAANGWVFAVGLRHKYRLHWRSLEG